MERAKAIAHVKDMYEHMLFREDKEALETLIPELNDNEDKRINRAIFKALSKKDARDVLLAEGIQVSDALTYFKKQEEQSQEELVYRLNGLMQEYIKEGKDDAEKEHRFKCYQLFWDALEDANFFEQKEQNPAEVDESTKRLNDNWMKQHFDDYEEQKSAQSREEILHQLFQNGSITLSDYLYLTGEQKPNKSEWSEEDEKIIDTIVSVLGQYVDYKAVSGTGSGYATPRYSKEIDWLKSLRPQYHGDVTMTEAYKMGKEAGEASHWKPSEKEITAFENMLKGEFLDGIFPGATLSELLTKLKKLYYNESISSWKPSEAQMREYSYWYRNFIESGLASPTSKAVTVLGELLEQLKKLM